MRTLRIEHEQESGCRVIVPGWASSLARLEHCVTFCAKAELVANSGNIVGQHEIDSLGPMTAAAGAPPLVGISIKKYRVTLVAEPPVALQARALGEIEGQLHAGAAAGVTSTGRATALVGSTVEEDRATFRTGSPSFWLSAARAGIGQSPAAAKAQTEASNSRRKYNVEP